MHKLVLLCFCLLPLLACKKDNPIEPMEEEENPKTTVVVEEVSVSGTENSYTFSVTLSSPDTGCDQYADWWEVLDEEGELLYRRVLGHSHVTEQPFTRSGGSVPISKDDIVIIRGHMNNSGYSQDVMEGSVSSGFSKKVRSVEFGQAVETQEPLPSNCAF